MYDIKKYSSPTVYSSLTRVHIFKDSDSDSIESFCKDLDLDSDSDAKDSDSDSGSDLVDSTTSLPVTEDARAVAESLSLRSVMNSAVNFVSFLRVHVKHSAECCKQCYDCSLF